MHIASNTFSLKTVFLLTIVVFLTGLTGCEKTKAPAPPPPPAVIVTAVHQETIPVLMDVAGTVQPVKTVKIIPRVSGYIFERNFTEGTRVQEGDSLYLIDPRPYQARFDQLTAKLERNQASLMFWVNEVKRYKRLAKQGAVSQENKEKAIARKAETTAAINQDKAEIENARLDLTFTNITAPFSGHIQQTMAHVGDLVRKHVNDLTTVVQIDPIYVIANISREQVYQIQELQEQGLAPKNFSEFNAELIMPDGSTYTHKGNLNYSSILITPSTDTLMVRYKFQNPKQGDRRSLIPGQYIPLRMIVGHRPDTLLIPEKCLLQTQEGTFVYVVSKENKVEKRMVTIGASYKQQWIIEKGLKNGERVISDGLQKVRPGMVVTLTDPKTKKKAAAQPTS